MRVKEFLLPILAAMMVLAASCSRKDAVPQGDSEDEFEGESSNLVKNGDFSKGTKFWDLFTLNSSAEILAADSGELEVRIKRPGACEYAVQPHFDGFALYQGGTYRYSFDVHSSIERTFEWRLQMNGGDYHAYASGYALAGKDVVHVEHTFTMREPTDFSPRLVMNVGKANGCPEGMGAHSIFFDNVALELVDDSGVSEIVTTNLSSKINLNQLGYAPSAKKMAVVKSGGNQKISGKFSVIDVQSDKEIFSGRLKDAKFNEASREHTAVADFSKVTAEGVYKIRAEGFGESFAFRIADDVYDGLFKSALRFFYLQRCGHAVDDAIFSHPECHAADAVVYGDVENSRDVSGGWHDAGDYGRYVVPAAKAVADLMLAYEDYSDAFGPAEDVLSEVKYELDWMLKMQAPETGAVYHKVTCAEFPGVVMPQDETDRLVLCPVSTAATADFAAAMAMASRIYSGSARAKAYASAAKKAWEYLEKTPCDKRGFSNPLLFTTGEYPDADDSDERFWALVELYRAFGDEKYLSLIREFDPAQIGGDFGWQQVGLYGLYSYLEGISSRDSFYKKVRKAFLAKADEKLAKSRADSYGVSLSPNEYVWGSNMGVANNGMLLLMAGKISADKKYAEAAKRQLDYLLGENTASYSFVTGFGTHFPILPHHRPSQVIKKTVPGMLVGGPNSRLEDPFARANLSEAPAAACYIDSVQSYSCNEVTIYWNSPLVYLIAGCGL